MFRRNYLNPKSQRLTQSTPSSIDGRLIAEERVPCYCWRLRSYVGRPPSPVINGDTSIGALFAQLLSALPSTAVFQVGRLIHAMKSISLNIPRTRKRSFMLLCFRETELCLYICSIFFVGYSAFAQLHATREHPPAPCALRA